MVFVVFTRARGQYLDPMSIDRRVSGHIFVSNTIIAYRARSPAPRRCDVSTVRRRPVVQSVPQRRVDRFLDVFFVDSGTICLRNVT